ncbi:hypothetical protein [Actinotalea solisilvae]|uniref:hypothetical protein n=1 Tax=Actinotalea solisilvae TaxID=2072922 RepID=UPI0018F1F3C7|nr:hypothetical protein [Actinotalea solisilvae]
MRRALIPALAALVTAAALSGCTATAEQPPDPDTSPVAVVDEPMPTVTAEPEQVVPTVGEVVTTPAQVTAAQSAGLGVYVTNDGTQLVIDPKAPVPQVVIDEARASGLGPAAPPDRATVDAQMAVLEAVVTRAAAAGKKVIFIFQTGTYGDWDDDDLKATHYGAYIPAELRTGPLNKPASPQEVRDKLQPRIDAQPDPSIYEFVDLTS